MSDKRMRWLVEAFELSCMTLCVAGVAMVAIAAFIFILYVLWGGI